MKRTPLMAVLALLALSACIQPEPVTGRADNDMLRFSAMNYVATPEFGAR
ncbi:hypothetical protein AB3Y40_03035 [Yoonia sp. R2331]